MDSRLHLFGIRHHGPGSAASLRQALDALDPAVVLIEGPPEADDIAALAAADGMHPPVALLTYPNTEPERGRFHPFAEFSPEWQALKWAAAHGRPARFIDAPILATDVAETEDTVAADDGDAEPDPVDLVAHDPLAQLASAAGHSDGEAWWNALIEQHSHAPDVFRAIEDAMTALRASRDEADDNTDEEEQRREAYMRLAMRKALRENEGEIAVVCGAWHLPALRKKGPASADRAVTKGLRAAKCAACWVPWTDVRLAAGSGYRAGVLSPAWYQHLWEQFGRAANRTEAVATWQARVARLLRTEGIAASTSSVIDATRLALSLSAVRNLSIPGLAEMRDASLAALCHGDVIPLEIINRELIVGSGVGEVDEAAPQPPLLLDLQRQQKRLRLKPEGFPKDIALDLRSQAGLAKSVLLHRLLVLGVDWGTLLDASAGRGTFREVWRIEWQPELSVALAEAAVHGVTVEQAAAAAARMQAREEDNCARLAALVRLCLLADLPDAADTTIHRLEAAAINVGDVLDLAGAVKPLVEVLRYGTARELRTDTLRRLVVQLLIEICAGIRYACHNLDAESAAAARGEVAALDGAVGLLRDDNVGSLWQDALKGLAGDDRVAALVRGLATRLLYDRDELPADTAHGMLSRALSSSVPPIDAATWFEGFINEAGEILLADDQLFGLVDGWLVGLHAESFVELLPMLRRAFSTFDLNTVQRMLERVRQGGGRAAAVLVSDPRAAAAFAAALPTLKTILGLKQS
ncbi:MAG: DUF5682 family protein [Pseudomonadota bacterium]